MTFCYISRTQNNPTSNFLWQPYITPEYLEVLSGGTNPHAMAAYEERPDGLLLKSMSTERHQGAMLPAAMLRRLLPRLQHGTTTTLSLVDATTGGHVGDIEVQMPTIWSDFAKVRGHGWTAACTWRAPEGLLLTSNQGRLLAEAVGQHRRPVLEREEHANAVGALLDLAAPAAQSLGQSIPSNSVMDLEAGNDSDNSLSSNRGSNKGASSRVGQSPGAMLQQAAGDHHAQHDAGDDKQVTDALPVPLRRSGRPHAPTVRDIRS